MGIYIYKRNMGPKKHWGKEEAKKGNVPTRTCPNCGEQAEPYEVYRDRVTYKCVSCNAINTYTVIPSEKNAPSKKTQKMGAVTLRDKSKPEKEAQVVVTRNKENVEDVFREENLEPEKSDNEVVNTVNTIKDGMKDAKILAFTYIDAHGNEKSRNIEPYKLTVDKKGDLILYGYCLEGRGIRTFKIQRIADCNKLDYSFDPQFPIEDKLVDYE